MAGITFHYEGKQVWEVLGDDRNRVEEVTFDTSITTIGVDAFYECTSLASIELPSNITSIGYEAFSSCESLKEIEIPPSVATIKSYAFYKCRNLQKVTISPSTTIQRGAFNGCPKLDEQSIQNINDCFLKIKIQDTFKNRSAPILKHNFKGSTQNGWGPEWWGITLKQMEKIMNHPLIDENTLMQDVVRLAIKPATKQCGLGYSLLLNQDKPLQAKVMVSVSTIKYYKQCLFPLSVDSFF